MTGESAGDRVRIGVTGHRFLAEVEKLRASVAEALDLITGAFPGRKLQCLSALAEGADRMVAHAVLERGGELTAVLPLPEDDYITDFDSPASKAEFRDLLAQATKVIQLPATATRNEAYEEGGLWVLDNSDVLIAIYDGKPAQGRGGTADIVARALERGMPVIHIKAGNRIPGTSTPTSLGPEQGEIVVHGLD